MAGKDQNIQFFQSLPAFLREAEKLGFIRDPRQWPAIFQILENAEDLKSLKFFLAPVVCANPEQQAAFYQLYDRWLATWSQEEQPEPTLDAELKRQRSSQPENYFEERPGEHLFKSAEKPTSKGPKWWHWLLLSAPIAALILGLAWWLGWSHPVSLFAFVFVALFIAWTAWRWKNRKIAVRQEHADRGDTFWDFRLPHRLISFGPEFKRLATRLRERVPGTTNHIHVPKTVTASAKAGGFFSPQFHTGTQLASNLLLIDLSNDNNHRATLFDALFHWLLDNEVPVERYFYRNVPHVLWNEENPQGVSLETLSGLYPNSRLFLLGDGWRLLNPFTAAPDTHSQTFLNWKDRVMVTPIPFPQWTARERSLESLFVIAPFTAEGLTVIEKHFNPEEPFDWALQRPDSWREPAILFDETTLPDSLIRYFPDPAMQEWLAALSFYPELNWNLTLFLGGLLSPPNRSLLSFENLRQLSRIHWFYNGFIPAKARETLYKTLNPEKAKTIHASIAGLLEEQLRQKDDFISHERDRLYLQILLHKAHAGMASREEVKELRIIAKDEKQDFLTARYTSQPMPWEWILPQEFEFLVPDAGELKAIRLDFQIPSAWKKWLALVRTGVAQAAKPEMEEPKVASTTAPIGSEKYPVSGEKPVVIPKPLKVFIAYGRADEHFTNELLKHLAILRANGLIEIWSDADLLPGEKWEKVIKEKLSESDLILLLLSADSLASDYIQEVELKIALERSNTGDARLIPILVRDCNWRSVPGIRDLMILPRNKDNSRVLPINSWEFRDEAWASIVHDLRILIQQINDEKAKATLQSLPELSKTLADEPPPPIIKPDQPEPKHSPPEMVQVQGGTFQMGEKGFAEPVRAVTLSDFAIGKYPVTQKLWQEVMGNNPSRFKGDDLPVESVSWDDVQDFLKKLNTKYPGQGYRLPTEAEWEYAARGGALSKGYQYAGSNNLKEVGWYWENSGDKPLSGEWKYERIQKNNCRTHPVGLKNANELGIYDMSGNVWEWCADNWHENYEGAPKDGSAWTEGGDASRAVLRGGSWFNSGNGCRSADRGWNDRYFWDDNVGFRCARASGGK